MPVSYAKVGNFSNATLLGGGLVWPGLVIPIQHDAENYRKELFIVSSKNAEVILFMDEIKFSEGGIREYLFVLRENKYLEVSWDEATSEEKILLIQGKFCDICESFTGTSLMFVSDDHMFSPNGSVNIDVKFEIN